MVSPALLIRHLLSIAALPFTVTVLIPMWLARRPTETLGAFPRGIALGLGAVFGAIGLALFLSSLRRFANEGNGTLAPWDPPRKLVVRGPYRYVRNPMISGVLFVLLAETMFLNSRAQLWWTLTFLVANLVYIPLLEEPMLRQRFGEAYVEYCGHVPRL